MNKEYDMLIIDNQNNVYEPIATVKRTTIKKEDIVAGVAYIELKSEEWDASIGEVGHYVIADVNKCGSYLCQFTEKEEKEYTLRQNLMPIFGVKNRRGTYLVIAEGMKSVFHVRVGLKNGRYYIAARFELNGDTPYEDISILHVRLDKNADYVEMAKYYRCYQLERGACIPLRERAAKNKELSYAADSVEIRIRMGWKPAPAMIKEQTPENEPDMKVACTFERVKDIIRELKIQGVDKAQICLVGWNKSGHDGRWPQIFPVEEKLGGEEQLRELIAYAKENGYQIVCHTNSTDCYRIAEGFDEDIVIKKKDGKLQKDPLDWSGGTMYHLCPQKAYEFAKRDLPKVAELGFRGIHYIDVMSVVPLRRCYDKHHPVTEADTDKYYHKIGNECKKLFGGFASEGAFDFTAKYLDYALYVSFGEHDLTFFEQEIPLWQIVYHGIILSNPSTVTVNYPIKAPESHMKLVEYGGRPSFYIYSKFITNASNENWLGKEDLECGTDEELKDAVKHIKSAYEEYKKMRYLQYEFIESYREKAKGIYEVTYSDGTVVLIDYHKQKITMGR